MMIPIFMVIQNHCVKKRYFHEINKFLELLKKNLKKGNYCRVSRSNYKENYFEGRKIISGKTISLVKNSKMVLMHNSTAVNYAIMYKKPIIFINSDNYLLHYNLSIKALAAELNLTDINLSKNINNISQPLINNDRYRHYFKKYIKANAHNNNESKSFELLYKYLINIYSKCIV